MNKLNEYWDAENRTPEERAWILDDAVYYEIITALGVTTHDETDYAVWEHLNYSRMGHARGLMDFFEKSKDARQRRDNVKPDDVVSEDFGFLAKKIEMEANHRDRLNKDLFHLTYSRLRHRSDVQNKPWPSTILNKIHERCVEFIKFLLSEPSPARCDVNRAKWTELLRILESGRTLCVSFLPDNRWAVTTGSPLPHNLSCLTKWCPGTKNPLQKTLNANTATANAVATTFGTDQSGRKP